LNALSQEDVVKEPERKRGKNSTNNPGSANRMPKASMGGGASYNIGYPAILCLDVEVVSDGTYWQFSQLGAVLSRAEQTSTFGAQVKFIRIF
jgi:hypothetical protein